MPEREWWTGTYLCALACAASGGLPAQVEGARGRRGGRRGRGRERGKGKVGGGGGGGRETDPGHGGRRERGEREGSSRGSRGRTKRHHPPAAKTIWSPIFTRMEPRPRRICPTQFEDVDDRNGRKTTTTSTAKRMMWRQSFARSNAAAPSKSAMLSSCRRGASRGGG